MRKKSIILAGLVVAVLGGLAWLVLRPSEPIYQGRRLSYWLIVQTSSRDTSAEKQARAAVNSAGTNAIPTLVQMLRAHDSAPKHKFYTMLDNQSLIKIHPLFAEKRNEAAVFGFTVLGEEASNAVPSLIDIYQQKISPSSQGAVALCLGFIGTPAAKAVPSLVCGTTNSDQFVAVTAILALGEIHANPDLVVPALIDCLSNRDTTILGGAASALGDFEKYARSGIPALEVLARDSNYYVLSQARLAILKIDPEAAARLPAVSPRR